MGSALDHPGLGGKHIEPFRAAGIIETRSDIFRLRDRRSELAEREGWGETSAETL